MRYKVTVIKAGEETEQRPLSDCSEFECVKQLIDAIDNGAAEIIFECEDIEKEDIRETVS